MKIGIVIYSNDPETVWNAFRFGNYAVKEGEAVQVFLIGNGVESESLDTGTFKITEQMRSFVEGGGAIAGLPDVPQHPPLGRLGIVSDINAGGFACAREGERQNHYLLTLSFQKTLIDGSQYK